MRTVITGAAGLVGQNLIPIIKETSGTEIVAIDKHPKNTDTLKKLHPDIQVVEADLGAPGPWRSSFENCSSLVILQAQIGGLDKDEFIQNNITATDHVLAAAKEAKIDHVILVSSSVVKSAAHDFYTETKMAQEQIVANSGFRHVILRPTLMFGWFDRKHLGWLRQFLDRSLIFPVPGNGKYLRQPLYAGDFSAIIASCLKNNIEGVYNITGLQEIYYLDLIRNIRDVVGSKTPIVKIPYRLFWLLLKLYALVDRNPPFTTDQLEALVTPETFEVIDWPGIFDVRQTPLRAALQQTFMHPEYSNVILDF